MEEALSGLTLWMLSYWVIALLVGMSLCAGALWAIVLFYRFFFPLPHHRRIQERKRIEFQGKVYLVDEYGNCEEVVK